MFSTTSSPTGRFPKDGKCRLRKAHSLLTSFLTFFFPKYLLPDTFGGVLDLSEMTALVSVTPLQQCATAPAAPLLEHCSSRQTFSQTSSAYETLRLRRGISLTLRQHLGF